MKQFIALLVGFIALIPVVVDAANPFSSNVIELTPKNWKQEVVDSPHAVFVNICRVG